MNPVQIHRIVLQWAYQSHTNIIIPPKTTPKALSIEDEKERTSGHQKKPLMPEPKRTGQHQEPGKERQDTQVVSLPNTTL